MRETNLENPHGSCRIRVNVLVLQARDELGEPEPGTSIQRNKSGSRFSRVREIFAVLQSAENFGLSEAS